MGSMYKCILYVLVLVSYLNYVNADICAPCECYLYVVNCFRIGITSIPSFAENIRKGVALLDRRYNEIITFNSTSFHGMQRLQFLRLHHNKIASISSTMFQGLTNLRILLLDSNLIIKVDDSAFDSISKLDTLS